MQWNTFNKDHGLRHITILMSMKLQSIIYNNIIYNNIHIHVMINNTSKLYNSFFNSISSLS